jgi:hypothetical protein
VWLPGTVPVVITAAVVGLFMTVATSVGAVAPRNSSAGAAPDVTQSDASWGVGAAGSPSCDGLDTSQCMLPFPNDYYSVPDRGAPTGRHIDFPAAGFPAAVGQAPFNPAPWAANDGFSPGSTILIHVGGINLAKSRVATISDIGASLGPSSPVVLLDETSGQRWPVWAELDVNDPNPATQLMMVHPARNLTEGDRYIVSFSNLRTRTGSSIPLNPAFAAVLGHTPGCQDTEDCPALTAGYANHLRGVVSDLGRAGVTAKGMYSAWDFTVASRQNLTAPALTMRNQSFAALGSGVPAYRIISVVNDPPAQPSLARRVTGTFEVPSYLSGVEGVPGTILTVGTDGLPARNGVDMQTATFDCGIPKRATESHPATVGLYGHGLFGDSTEVYQSQVPQFSEAYDYVFCATDWVGLSSSTVSLAATVVSDLNRFPSLVDNLMQSLLNTEFLGRLLDSNKGLATSAPFKGTGGRPVIRTNRGLVYYGNSEGGIMGGAFTALSTDTHRSVLGVPGMDYDVLLTRSADFAPYLTILNGAYPSKSVQNLGFDIIEMLWDRGEADGYAEQMTGGLPDTPQHQVILAEAFGDHQVANIATETEARTIGADLRMPGLSPGRSNQAQPLWGLAPLPPDSTGPALIIWDSGVPPAPPTNTPPTAGNDPHDWVPRSLPRFWTQMNTFFQTGRVSNVCGTGPCKAPYPPNASQ